MSICFSSMRSTRYTPVDELLATLDTLVAQGKLRHVGVSNYPGWQLMKALAAADRHGWPRFVRAPGLLLADRPRLRGRSDAARRRPGRRRAGVEPARLGPADRQDRARPSGARRQPPARYRTVRASGKRRAPLPRDRRDRSGRRRDRQEPSRRSRSTGCSSGRPCRR